MRLGARHVNRADFSIRDHDIFCNGNLFEKMKIYIEDNCAPDFFMADMEARLELEHIAMRSWGSYLLDDSSKKPDVLSSSFMDVPILLI